MGVGAYVAVSAALFALGIVAIITRRNVLYVLMGIEMILNAANINFVAFNRFNGDGLDGRMFALFTIILLTLVVGIVWVRARLLPGGELTITVNGEKSFTTQPGGKLLGCLADQGIFIASAR